jgi:fumarate reductase subunit C
LFCKFTHETSRWYLIVDHLINLVLVLAVICTLATLLIIHTSYFGMAFIGMLITSNFSKKIDGAKLNQSLVGLY